MKHLKTPTQSLKEIRPDAWYRLADIVDNQWIINTVGKSSKRYLYRLIEHGNIPAKDRGLGKKQPLWMILGSDIANFIKKNCL